MSFCIMHTITIYRFFENNDSGYLKVDLPFYSKLGRHKNQLFSCNRTKEIHKYIHEYILYKMYTLYYFAVQHDHYSFDIITTTYRFI